MCRWVDVVNVFELTPGSRCLVDVYGNPVVVFNLDGDFFAIKDACPNDGAELSKGLWVGEEIICPSHGDRFSIRTGAALEAPAYEHLDTFPLRVSAGKVQVEIEVAG